MSICTAKSEGSDYDQDDIRLGMEQFGISEASACPADINGDGEVGADDLGLLLSAWGVCIIP